MTRRADRGRVVEQALRRQDEQTRKDVEAFLARVEGVEPDHTVQVGSVIRRRVVPIAIETRRAPVYERAHLVFSWSRVYGEDAHAAQSVVVRTERGRDALARQLSAVA